MNAWIRAVELAERELTLVRAGEWDLVAQVSDERARHTATLPQATEAVRPVLERLAALEAALVETLQAARTGAVRELGSLRRGRGAMRGYAGTAGSSAGGFVDHAA